MPAMILLFASPLVAFKHGLIAGGLLFGTSLIIGNIAVLVARTRMTDGPIPWARHFWCVLGRHEYETVEETVATGPRDTWRKHYKCDRCGQTVHMMSKLVLDTEEEAPG